MIAKNLKEWHRIVCERDAHKCQLRISIDCKGNYSYPVYWEEGENPYVCGDHLKPRNVAPELKLETTNGKCVCKLCHALRDHKELPDGYLEPAIDTDAEIARIAIAGARTHYIYEFKKCKCGRNAMPSGYCLSCEPGHKSFFKSPKKSKK